MNNQPSDVLIIGAGIVGLSSAYQLLKNQPKLRIEILEKESTIASHQTGNNSGVLHSGIYYTPGSLKAENCKRGYKLMLAFCDRHKIDYELCGKLIVASSDDELETLDAIYQRGVANGLKGLKFVNQDEMKVIEPNVMGIKGIWVPQSGIVNFKKVAAKLKDEIEKMGGKLSLSTKLRKITNEEGKVIAWTGKNRFETKMLLNCAGLYCDKVAKLAGENPEVRIIPFRGEYFKLKEKREGLVNNLIYPVPNPEFPFLGVHFTKMIEGGVEAGPNAVLAYRKEGYKKFDIHIRELLGTLLWPGFRRIVFKYGRTGMYELFRSLNKSAFTRALQKLVPAIKKSDLTPSGAGVRAQACDRKGNLLDDFCFLEKPDMLHVLNAPSPAATSSLAIGEQIAEKVLKKL